MDRLAERLKNLSPLQRAVVALKETQARLDALERADSAEPIAVVGMACRFPGGAVDPQSYWQLLCGGVDAIRETPPRPLGRRPASTTPIPPRPARCARAGAGISTGSIAFDNHFFGISDREAVRIDPQQRLLLELSWEALEDAGLPPSSLRGTKTGVFVGISVSEYGIMLSSDVAQTDAHAAAGTSLCLAANRLSFVFGLQGPSMALDTACSSSLVAVHLACQNIRNGECEMALAGGTNLLLSPLGTINLTKAGFCAPDGRVRAFDAAASRICPQRRGGHRRAQALGGRPEEPRPDLRRDPRQRRQSERRQQRIDRPQPRRAGTGPAGSLRPGESLARGRSSTWKRKARERAWATPSRPWRWAACSARGGRAGGRCAIGSVKTNLGHLETASGVASLMKAALALKHRQLPPNLHFHTPNPDIPFDRLPLRVVQKLEPWPDAADQDRGLAGVSGFGFGGSNAHIVLEEAAGGL